MIVFHEESKTFHLYNNEISYVFKILENNQLGQLYYGKRIHDRKDFDHLLELFPRPMSPCSYKGDLSFSLEHIKQAIFVKNILFMVRVIYVILLSIFYKKMGVIF